MGQLIASLPAFLAILAAQFNRRKPEQELIENSPQYFERVASSRNGLHFAYRFKLASSF